MSAPVKMLGVIEEGELQEKLRRIVYRGVFDADDEAVHPYGGVKFSLVKVEPGERSHLSPLIEVAEGKKEILYTPQPTIYGYQTEVLRLVDEFLKREYGKALHELGMESVNYQVENGSEFHVTPPIIEKHTLMMKDGFLDLDGMAKIFEGYYTHDARGKLHHLAERYLEGFFIDKLSCVRHMDIFHDNVEVINYGPQVNGPLDVYIVCDGAHRLDLSLNYNREVSTAILVEAEREGTDGYLPYYALPQPFLPTTRLTSKQAERKYGQLDIDKIHLLNGFLKKILHYDWESAGLLVSKLRSKFDIY